MHAMYGEVNDEQKPAFVAEVQPEHKQTTNVGVTYKFGQHHS